MGLGCAVYSPGNDFIQGLVSGGMDYTDYVRNTMSFLEVCDAVALVPSTWSKNSIGTRNEILRARQLGIPVLYNFDEVKSFVL
jgi:translation elongation factor EF-Tu-like GTPase